MIQHCQQNTDWQCFALGIIFSELPRAVFIAEVAIDNKKHGLRYRFIQVHKMVNMIKPLLQPNI